MAELLDRIDSRELTEWIAFDSIEPIGTLRDDYNNAMLCAILANANRRSGSQPMKLVDFMPFAPIAKPTPDEVLEEQLRALFPVSMSKHYAEKS